MPAWNSWYHVPSNTYGTWLPGDPRGWKTRHARRQPGADDPPRLFASSRRSLRAEPVTLCPRARQTALIAWVAALEFHRIELVVCAVDDHHAHTLARFPDGQPRRWIGIAKKESARELSRAGLAPAGGVWAVRSHCKPIRDREHQLEVYRYIAAHADRGAALWCLGQLTAP